MLNLNDLGNMLIKSSNPNTIRLSCPCIFNTIHSYARSMLEYINVDTSAIEGSFKYYEDNNNLILFIYGTLNKKFKMLHDSINGLNIFIISYDRLLVIENVKDLIKDMKNIFRLILFENGIQYHNINIVNDPEIIDIFHKNLPDRVWLEAIYSIWGITEDNTILEESVNEKYSYDELLKTMRILKDSHKPNSSYLDEE